MPEPASGVLHEHLDEAAVGDDDVHAAVVGDVGDLDGRGATLGPLDAAMAKAPVRALWVDANLAAAPRANKVGRPVAGDVPDSDVHQPRSRGGRHVEAASHLPRDQDLRPTMHHDVPLAVVVDVDDLDRVAAGRARNEERARESPAPLAKDV